MVIFLSVLSLVFAALAYVVLICSGIAFNQKDLDAERLGELVGIVFLALCMLCAASAVFHYAQPTSTRTAEAR